eukprot:1184506-Prorocentrum_minimum.AAC.2
MSQTRGFHSPRFRLLSYPLSALRLHSSSAQVVGMRKLGSSCEGVSCAPNTFALVSGGVLAQVRCECAPSSGKFTPPRREFPHRAFALPLAEA